ncbi:h1 histone-like protein [Leishmania mexicana MHOM/GT/2001/U1103]|uniref:H1 histone-like protein n=1 Tax=Leishmania mexicana (strain MHOM/GT/2001/U1103) TaxID=929439 RepID=E9B4G3_LEIMU|nr:h1 histone-like protein [Leishmania mexicana MHOM/GT/2001/U1103]CBZ30132.1 h1 histone-like protein [Leishmania mexicana MHOM/GT/2001/U1103]
MFRFTLRALARKAPAKAGSRISAAAGATAAFHTASAAPQTAVSIPPIPGVRSVRAFRTQKMEALQPPPVAAAGKKAPAAKGSKHPKAALNSRPSKKVKLPKKAAVPVKAQQAKQVKHSKQVKAPKSAAKEISKKAKSAKAGK